MADPIPVVYVGPYDAVVLHIPDRGEVTVAKGATILVPAAVANGVPSTADTFDDDPIAGRRLVASGLPGTTGLLAQSDSWAPAPKPTTKTKDEVTR